MALGIGSGLVFSSPDCGCEYYRVTVNSDEGTGGGSIRMDLDLDGNITKEVNDTITTTCKMFLTDTASWSGGTVNFRIANGNGDYVSSGTVNTETLVSIDKTYTVSGNNYLDIHSFQFNIMGSQPNANSTVFIAKTKVVVKKADGTVKATRTFDTSECASANPFTGLNKFQPSMAVASIGNCYESLL
jgi:hypothetical protein|tara:strand:+ start:394 stop:954 length:561 start_codon:yes stop_codon:yes gene_type:complete